MENQAKAPAKRCLLLFFGIFLVIGLVLLYATRLPVAQQNSQGVILESRTDINISRRVEPGIENNQLCTFAMLREYYANNHKLPGAGVMLDVDTDAPYYKPSYCNFQYHTIGADALSHCFARGNIKSIMTGGDSNARNYFNYLVRFFTSCRRTAFEKLKENGFVPDADYYKKYGLVDEKWAEFLEVRFRFCRWCAGQRYACSFSDSTGDDLLLEHLPMTLVLENSIQLHAPNYAVAAYNIDKVWALTSQEYFFRYFLQGRYPDVFSIFLPFNHAKVQLTERIRIDITYFHAMAKFYFPSSTKLIYIPAFGEFENKRRKKKWVNATFEQLLATDKIDKLNQVMYEVLERDLLNSTSNTYSFFDLLNISRPLERWSVDGVHMDAPWYQAALSMILETLCNSVALNAF